MKIPCAVVVLLLTHTAVAIDKPAACEIAAASVIGRTPSGIAQVTNLGNTRVTCRIPGPPFPTAPNQTRNGLSVATAAYEISEDGTQRLVPSENRPIGEGGGGLGSDSEPEWIDFLIHIPLAPTELDEEASRYVSKIEKSVGRGEITEADHLRAMNRVRKVVYQDRVGHFRIECKVMDGTVVKGIGTVEIQVVFKGRFSDVGLPGAPPV